MSAGRNVRLVYSGGVATPVTVNSDPALSIGGGPPPSASFDPTLDELRPAELYGASEWVATLTNPQRGRLAAAFTASLIFAEVGDWLFCVEQNDATPGSYSAANDCRGSFARIAALAGDLGETSNETAEVDVVLDRPIAGLPEAGDNVRVCKAGNLFANVSGAQAVAGRVDHRMIYLHKTGGGSATTDDDLQVWLEPIISHGVTLEVMRPGPFLNGETLDNVLADETASPVNDFGRVTEEVLDFASASALLELPSQDQARLNGHLRTTSSTAGEVAPFWIRRTVPPGTPPGLCIFALRVTSETSQDEATSLAAVDQLRSGCLIVFEVAPAAVHLIEVEVDRKLYASGQARARAIVTDGMGTPLPNRWVTISASIGTVTQDVQAFTDAVGRTRAILTVPAGSEGDPITLSASLILPP